MLLPVEVSVEPSVEGSLLLDGVEEPSVEASVDSSDVDSVELAAAVVEASVEPSVEAALVASLAEVDDSVDASDGGAASVPAVVLSAPAVVVSSLPCDWLSGGGLAYEKKILIFFHTIDRIVRS